MVTRFTNYAATAVGLHNTDDEPVLAPPYGGTVRLNPDFTSQSVIDALVGSETASAEEEPDGVAPENTVAPSISGTARVGETLTASAGEWTGDPAPTFAYQWYAGSTPIAGATGATLALTPDQLGLTISLSVTGLNEIGSAGATSAPTAAVVAALAPPVNSARPVISGTARVGETLTVSNGTWKGNPTPTYTRTWFADGNVISGATGTTFVLTTEQLGAAIAARVTGTNSLGYAQATSAATAAVVAALAAPANTAVPTITGNAVVGQNLTASNGTWTGNPNPTYTRQWMVDGVDVPGASGTTFAVTADHVGSTISVRVTATNSQGNATGTSAPTAAVVPANAAPVNTVLPVISGDTSLGSTLTTTPGTWTGYPTPTLSYSWEADGTPVGTNSPTYVIQDDDVGKMIRVTVRGTNSTAGVNAMSEEVGPASP